MDINRIKSEVLDAGLARKGRFNIYVDRMLENQTLLAKSAGIASVSLGMASYRYTPPMQQNPNDIIFDDLEIIFYVDKNYNIRKVFSNWLDEIVDPETGLWGYRDDYARDIIVEQLDEANNVKVRTKYLSCIPKTLGALQSAFESSEEIHELPVTFVYQTYRIID